MPTAAERRAMIEKLRSFPAQLEALVKPLSIEDLTTPYQPNEWTVAQNVHHLADSHMNAFIRLKLILAEDRPTLKPYRQDDWAKLPEATGADIAPSLSILKGLHPRWCLLLESLHEADWDRLGLHPEYGETTIADQVRIYSDHGEGHIRQINETLAAKKK